MMESPAHKLTNNTYADYLTWDDETNELIIQTAFIGDALLSIPLLKNLMRFYPAAEVTYLCRAGMGDFLSRLNLVKVVMEVDKSKASGFSSIQRQLKTQKWDWIICPHESLRSQFLCHGLRASRKTSFKNLFNGITFGERIERPMDLPEALRSLSLLQNAQPEIKLWFEKFRKDQPQKKGYGKGASTTKAAAKQGQPKSTARQATTEQGRKQA